MENGYVVLPEFLTAKEFAAVKCEHALAIGSAQFISKRVLDTAGLVRISAPIGATTARYFPVTLERLLCNKEITEIIEAYDGRALSEDVWSSLRIAFWRLSQADRVAMLERSDHTNTELHADSFHSIIKGFYFLHDTDEATGAHRVVRGSHKLGMGRLTAEYVNSVTKRAGSPRAPKWMVRISGGETVLALPANTLVMEDTFAYHASGIPLAGRQRDIVYLEYRGTAAEYM